MHFQLSGTNSELLQVHLLPIQITNDIKKGAQPYSGDTYDQGDWLLLEQSKPTVVLDKSKYFI